MGRNWWRERNLEELHERRSRDLGILLTGIGIGTAIALLLAPASGEDVRHALDRRYRKTVRRIGRHTEDLGDRAEDLLDRVQDLRDRGSRIFQFGRGELRRRA